MTNSVLVTGGSGFIGTWVLRELLGHGATPVVVDREPATERWQRVLGNQASDVIWTDASLLDCDALQAAIERHNVAHIIHLAALLTPACQQDPRLGCEVNVLGSTTVFEAARQSGQVRSISYASSYAVYGGEFDDGRDRSADPPMFYGAFKLAVDLIAEQYWRHFTIPSMAVRPHIVYGPERTDGLTAGPSLAARAAVRGERYCIGYSGRAGYDYVEDVARAFVRSAFECPPGASIVDLPCEQATTADFARAITETVADSVGNITVNGPSIPANVPPNPHYITEVFNDWVVTPLSEGVRRTVEYYRALESE